MWLLKGPKGEIHYLVAGKEHIVGRKDGDLVFADDQSISRKHTVISVQHPTENWSDPDKRPVVKITEPGSKYGTVINPGSSASKMTKNTTQELHDGDIIQFGLQWNTWKLVHEPLVVVMSTLTGLQKKEVRDIVGNVGGHIVSNWQLNCTHLTMSSFTMTVKAIIALAHGKAIVVPEFWRKFLSAIQNKEQLPKYEEFIPPLAETIINKNEVSFLINPERKKLFHGKEYFFFTAQQHGDHSCLVIAAGGTSSVLDLNQVSEEKLIEPNIIIMQHLSNPNYQMSQTPQTFMKIITYLQSHGRRVIPVSEIGLAILHCSTEKYCNPSFSFASAMLVSSKNDVVDTMSQQTLVSETQSQTSQRRMRNNLKGNVIIPESGTESMQAAHSTKQIDTQPTLLVNSSTATEKMASQKQSAEKNDVGSQENSLSNKRGHQKRSRSDDYGDDVNHPSKKSATIRPNSSGRSLRSKTDDTDRLFDFANDDTRNDCEEDMFAFKDPLPAKVKVENDEDMFSFEKTQKVETQEFLTSTLDSSIQKNNMKRKLSSSDENEISSRLVKKPAQQINPTNSKSEFDYSLEESQVETSEFLSAPDVKKEKTTDNGMSNGTCNSSVVVVKSLVTPQASASNISSTETTVGQNTKNFKKFRKVQVSSFIGVPHIIGGRDMVPYSKNASAAICNLFKNDDDDGIDEEKDDWSFPTPNQTKRKGHSRRL